MAKAATSDRQGRLGHVPWRLVRRSRVLCLAPAMAGTAEPGADVAGADVAGADLPFTVTATDGTARAGVLRTAHGDVPTPAFMPVGTKATVKTVDPDELRAIGTTILLGNTYHLHFRPGEDVISELGGLHRFMGWDGPILTDSGGFQVFSLAQTRKIDADGVTFRSVYDGALARFTPELAM